MIITIDGPAGAGKSTVAREIARRLGYLYLDTGALYRALTWAALQQNLPVEKPEAEAPLAELATHIRLELAPVRVLVDDRDVTAEIRAPEVSRRVSYVARFPAVRAALLSLQKRIGAGGHVVAEGRDIGTMVFPQAALKIFLVASTTNRAQRRAQDLAKAGYQVDLTSLEQEIRQRDYLDMSRTIAPLTKAADAIEIDTDQLTAVQVIDRILQLIPTSAWRSAKIQ